MKKIKVIVEIMENYFRWTISYQIIDIVWIYSHV